MLASDFPSPDFRWAPDFVDAGYYHHSPSEKFLQRQVTVSGFGNSLGLASQSRSAEKMKKRGRFVMLPHSPYRIAWSCFGLLLVFYDAISIPLVVSWELSNAFVSAMSILAMVYWSIDMILSTQTGFFEAGELVLSSTRALMHYLKSWFLFDATLVSLDWVMLSLEGNENQSLLMGSKFIRIIRVVRTLRLIRLLKLNDLVRLVEEHVSTGYTQSVQLVAAVVKSVVAIMFSVHLLGCFWYYVGRAELESGDDNNWLIQSRLSEAEMVEQYLACCHWILGQFTPAPMNIHAGSLAERVYNIFVIFFSLLVMGSSISRVSASIQAAIKIKSEATDRRRQVTQYLRAGSSVAGSTSRKALLGS